MRDVVEPGQVTKYGNHGCREFRVAGSYRLAKLSDGGVGDRFGNDTEDILKYTATEQLQCGWAGSNFGCGPEPNSIRRL